MTSSFVTFGSSLLTSLTKTSEQDHITLITPDHKLPQYPKVWVLSIEQMDVQLEQTIEVKPNQSEATDSYSYEKKDTKKKGKKVEQQKIVKNPDDKPKEGVISCIVVRDFQKVNVDKKIE